MQAIPRPNKGTPKRGAVKEFCQELAKMFHGAFERLTSYGTSTQYLLTLQLPQHKNPVTFTMGTTIEAVHTNLEPIISLLEQAQLIAPSPANQLILGDNHQARIERAIGTLKVSVEIHTGTLIVDLAKPKGEGPRLWITRGQEDSGKQGWRLLIHPDDQDPQHCVFIRDDAKTIIHDAKDPDATWPGAI